MVIVWIYSVGWRAATHQIADSADREDLIGLLGERPAEKLRGSVCHPKALCTTSCAIVRRSIVWAPHKRWGTVGSLTGSQTIGWCDLGVLCVQAR